MTPEEALERHGGLASRAAVIGATSRAETDAALARGLVVRLAAGRLALPDVAEAPRVAHQLTGVLSHTSAALAHGWEVLRAPDRPHVTVRRGRRLTREQRRLAHVHYADLDTAEVNDRVTRHETTLLDCLRGLPTDEGLAIADSALRHGVTPSTLTRIGTTVRGAGAGKVRRLCALASADAANPFESGLRAICDGVPGLLVTPQATISSPRVWARPDLVDRHLRIVLEADSFEWHGSRPALAKDARRYNLLVADGWLVLRFTWEEVMFRQDRVREVLAAVVAIRLAEVGQIQQVAA